VGKMEGYKQIQSDSRHLQLATFRPQHVIPKQEIRVSYLSLTHIQ
jgi:hypothetical protein